MQDIHKIVIHGWNPQMASIAEGIRHHSSKTIIYCPDAPMAEFQQALKEGYVDELPERTALIYEDADFVLLNHSYQETYRIIKTINTFLDPDTYIMDFSSIKSFHYDKMKDLLTKENPYISVFPFMDTMPLSARRDIFKDKIVAVVAEHTTDILSDVKNFWSIFQANIVPTSADFFDEIFSATMQGPYLLASIYSNILLRDSWTDTLFFGFYNKMLRNFTSSLDNSPQNMAEKLIYNRENIMRTLAFIQREMEQVVQMLDDENIEQLTQYIQNAETFKNRI